ncbi:MAG: hypothetical protein MHM6MM_009432, partial [Cercozoa sp. M6MM]
PDLLLLLSDRPSDQTVDQSDHPSDHPSDQTDQSDRPRDGTVRHGDTETGVKLALSCADDAHFALLFRLLRADHVRADVWRLLLELPPSVALLRRLKHAPLTLLDASDLEHRLAQVHYVLLLLRVLRQRALLARPDALIIRTDSVKFKAAAGRRRRGLLHKDRQFATARPEIREIESQWQQPWTRGSAADTDDTDGAIDQVLQSADGVRTVTRLLSALAALCPASADYAHYVPVLSALCALLRHLPETRVPTSAYTDLMHCVPRLLHCRDASSAAQRTALD